MMNYVENTYIYFRSEAGNAGFPDLSLRKPSNWWLF